MTVGIYQIRNLVDDKIYIGQSVHIETRFKEHKHKLQKGKHPNIHLQRAWRKYGEENFVFEIIEECFEEELNDKEIHFISKSSSLYNIQKGGQAWIGGVPQEIKERIRTSMRGKLKGEKHPLYGRGHSLESRRKMSESKKGLTHNEEWRKKQSERMKGEKNPSFGKNFQTGEKNGRAILNETKVREIKIMLGLGVNKNEIAKKFGVTTKVISKIRRGETWSHVVLERAD